MKIDLGKYGTHSVFVWEVESEDAFLKMHDTLVSNYAFWNDPLDPLRSKEPLCYYRGGLLGAWKSGKQLYQLCVKETHELFKDNETRLKISRMLGCHPATLQLPVYCWRDGKHTHFVWTHPLLRGRGLGSFLVKNLPNYDQ